MFSHCSGRAGARPAWPRKKGKPPLSLGLPRVLIGHNHSLPLDLAGVPIDIVFRSELGTVVLEVSLPGCTAPAAIVPSGTTG